MTCTEERTDSGNPNLDRPSSSMMGEPTSSYDANGLWGLFIERTFVRRAARSVA